MAAISPNTSSVRVLRVFIASPGDLGAERQAAREAVDEINQTVARPAGFHVDLIGWEDTLSAMGRPQALINEDLLSCQMFIGLLWEKWGTPPDTEGKYTSGFEEEFDLATSEYEKNGIPSISLLFKEIDDSKLSDVGPSLAKVLAFKDKITSEKKVLYESFSTVDDFAKKIRILISSRIHRIATQEETGELLPSEGSSPQASETQSIRQNELTMEAAFLADLAGKISVNDEQPSGLEIARLRNIAFSYSYESNDQQVLGPHDANLIYRYREDLTLSPGEINSLVNAGLNYWDHQNAPLWTWLNDRISIFDQYLSYKTLYGPDDVRKGAFSAMLALSLEPDLTGFSVKEWGNAWFGGDTSDRIKNAALDFIGKSRLIAFKALADAEHVKAKYATRQNALEACILIRAAIDEKDAAAFAATNSFDQLSEAALRSVKRGMRDFDGSGLRIALEHRNSEIKAEAILLLGERGLLDAEELRGFFGEGRFAVRAAAVHVFEHRYGPLPLEEAKKALVVEQKGGGLLSSNYDAQGNEEMQRRRRSETRKRSESELQSELAKPGFDTDDLQFALWEKDPRKWISDIRAAIDDGFNIFWQNHLERAKSVLPPGQDHSTVIKLLNEHRDYRCKAMMRRALDLIVGVRDRNDLERVRKNIDEERSDSDVADIRYLEKFGTWEDISRIDRALSNQPVGLGVGTLLGGKPLEDRQAAAKAVLHLAGSQVSKLLKDGKLSAKLLVEVLKAVPQIRLRKTGMSTLNNLFSHDDAAVRKTAALKILIAFGRKEVISELDGYLQSDKYRYYNVVFWLDLARAFDKARYSALAKNMLGVGE